MKSIFQLILAICVLLPGGAYAGTNVRDSEAYTLASAEAGSDLDPQDRSIAVTEKALSNAATFFKTSKKEIAKAAFHHAWQSRDKGVPMTALALLRDGPIVARQRASIGRNLAGFNTFAEVYVESANSAKAWSEVSAAQGVIRYDTGAVNHDAAETVLVITAIQKAAQHYNTDAPNIAAIALQAAKERRGASAFAIIHASTQPHVVAKHESPPNMGTFMMFAANFRQ